MCNHSTLRTRGPCNVLSFLFRPLICPTIILQTKPVTPAQALHGYCDDFSPEDLKTQPWSPQCTATRPASASWLQGTLRSVLWLRSFLIAALGASVFFSQAQTRVLLGHLILIPQRDTADNLLIQVDIWEPFSQLTHHIYLEILKSGVKSLDSKKESHYISLKTLRLGANLHKIFSDYLRLNKLIGLCSSHGYTISFVINYVLPCDDSSVLSLN